MSNNFPVALILMTIKGDCGIKFRAKMGSSSGGI